MKTFAIAASVRSQNFDHLNLRLEAQTSFDVYAGRSASERSKSKDYRNGSMCYADHFSSQQIEKKMVKAINIVDQRCANKNALITAITYFNLTIS